MNGFAPLIEGFVAFALTMLALTTAVSAIVGSLQHLRRRHARGLRDMVRVLYMRDLRPLVNGASPDGAIALTDKLAEPSVSVVAAIGAALRDLKQSVSGLREKAKAFFNKVKASFKPLTVAAKHKTPPTEKTKELATRTQFIFDMTFMPVPDVVEKIQKDDDGSLDWLTRLASAERLVGMPWYTTVFHPKRLARRWRTLRCGLGELPDAEFLDRLSRSELGTVLRDRLPVPGFDDWDKLLLHLLHRFKTIGGASTETFARHCRGWSVVVGFLLAVGLNIDSIDLLNSYLTNPQLRQDVIAQSDKILAQETPAPDAQGATALARTRKKVDTATSELTAAARQLEGTVQTLAALGPDGQKAADTLKTGLQGLLTQVEGVQDGANAFEADATQARAQILGVTRSLTTSFPIGWQRFPNCGAASSPDLRCEKGPFPPSPTTAPAWQDGLTWLTGWLPDSGISTSIAGGSQTLAAASVAEPARFYQWLFGILLTTVLLGLGSPFWVKVVSSALNLSRAAKGDTK
jgi:hypothetical protein